MQLTTSVCSTLSLVIILCACNANIKPQGISGNDSSGNGEANLPNARGKELFEQRCIACHGVNGNYRNNNAANLRLTKLDNVIGIVATTINGLGAMPSSLTTPYCRFQTWHN